MKNKVKELSPTECAYIAGIIDGEGGLAISKRPPNKKKGDINPSYLRYLKIGSTDPNLLLWIQEKVGHGTIYQEGREGPKRKPFYTWHVSNKQLDRLLEQVYPYLVIKKDQVDVIVALQKTIDLSKPTRDGVPPAMLVERERCFLALKKMHTRRFLPQSHFDLP